MNDLQKKLQENLKKPEFYELTRHLLINGAGTMLTLDDGPDSVEHGLSDALADPIAGEWESEIGLAVASGDGEKLRAMKLAIDNARKTGRRKAAGTMFIELLDDDEVSVRDAFKIMCAAKGLSMTDVIKDFMRGYVQKI